MRLDLYLFEHGLTESREQAKRLILSGAVLLDGMPCKKPSLAVEGEVQISIETEKYVGRGAYKLEAALSLFGIDPTGLCALDIGASTGGFTDCLLQHGAAFVTALDVGQGQLHPKLCADARVKSIEKYNARELSREDVGEVSLVVMDVSFISQTYILPRIPQVLAKDGALISLIKPQFEAGRQALGKNGVVKDPADKLSAIRRVAAAAETEGLALCGIAPSPILGGDGNQEFLAYFKHAPLSGIVIDQTVLQKAVIQ